MVFTLCTGTILVAVIPFGSAASLSGSSGVLGFRRLVKSCPVRPLPMLPKSVRTLFPEMSMVDLALCSSENLLWAAFDGLIVSDLLTISLKIRLSRPSLIARARDISACKFWWDAFSPAWIWLCSSSVTLVVAESTSLITSSIEVYALLFIRLATVVFSKDSESLVRFAPWGSCIEVEMGRSKVEGVVSWL